MSFAAAFVLISQSIAPVAAEAPAAPVTGPVAERVSASVTILRPARISFQIGNEAETSGQERVRNVQRGRDAAGTVWIEFS